MSYNGVIYCDKCYKNLGTHSIRIIKDGEIPILYTKIAEAREYSDMTGILQHYRNLLRLLGDKEWIWFFDCDNLEMKHCFEIGTSRGIIDLIRENGKNKKIYVINSNMFLTIILDSCKLFLDSSIRDRMEIFSKSEYKQFINNFIKILITILEYELYNKIKLMMN